MGQDFVARKAAKKQRKRQARDAETGRKKRRRKEDGFEIADDDGLGNLTAEQVKRRRKKGNNVSLRISRALCYKPPELTPEDLKWDGTADGEGDDAAATAYTAFDDMAEAGYDSDVEEALQKPQQQQAKQQKQPAALKLSTAVSLLDRATAAKLAGKKHQQQHQQQQPQCSKAGQQQLDETIASAPALAALSKAGLDPVIARCMAKLGFLEPTPIQSAAWGPAAAGRDVLGHAEPGSGKTLSYLLPAFAHLSSCSARQQQQQPAGSDDAAAAAAESAVQPRVLVVLPSRELAQQVHAQCVALFTVTGISTAVVYGGVLKEQQVAVLQRRQPQLLVATPGRLLDLLDSGVLGLSSVNFVVLDEADKMLSVGFEPQLQRLKALLLERQPAAAAAAAEDAAKPSKKKHKKQKKALEEGSNQGPAAVQVLLFSATLPKAVRQTADAWLNPGCQSVSCSAGADSISRTITQVVQVCAEHKKPAKLLKHLAAIKAAAEGLRNPPRVLVFANRIKTVTFVHRTLTEAGYRAVVLHGKRSQQEREAAVADFKAGKAQVLVASDVASRGLDIRGLPYVVNYDFPSNLEVYIHRVGRTGRLAAAGHAFSFFTRPLAKLAAPLIDLLSAHQQSIDPNLLQLSEAWQQAEAALQARGLTAAALAAAAAAEGGAEGDDEQEEEELKREAAGDALPEDLQEGLTDRQQAARAAAAAKEGQALQQVKRSSKKHSGDTLMVPQAPAAAAAAAATAGGQGAADTATAAPPAFIPAAKFAGAREGYAFKKGSRGVGYYLDPVQQQQQMQMQGKAKQQHKQEQRKALQQALKQYKQHHQGKKQQQTGSGKPGEGQAAAAAGAGRNGGGKSELPPLPGLAMKRKLPAFAASGDLSDDDGAGRVLDGSASDSSDSEGEGVAGRGGSLQQRLERQEGGKKRKALPGRLRKKLAKAAAARGQGKPGRG